jgi:tRNA wybutosine-synthesizing protein 3
MRSSNTPLPQSFLAKKKVILDQLSVPISEYDDLSPKGSIDVDIRDLIDEINQLEGCVTTSSCSGRVSVFLEGMKQAGREGLDDDVGEENEKAKEKARQDEPQGFGDDSGFRKTTVGVGGKGGGTWLYVSHSEVDISQYESAGDLLRLLGMDDLHDGLPPSGRTRFIHFKFEPMVSSKILICTFYRINTSLTTFRSFMFSQPLLSRHKLLSPPLCKLDSVRAVPSI